MGLGGLLGCFYPSLGARAKTRERLLNTGDIHSDGNVACASLERVNIDFFIRQPKQADSELLAYLVLARDDADGTACGAEGTAASEVFSVAFASGSLLSYLGCSSRQDYLARLGGWLAADEELADQFARLVRCASCHRTGMVVYPLDDGIQLQDGVYNLTLTVKSCLIVDAEGVLSSEGAGPGRPALAVSHKLSRLDDLSAMRQQEIALTTIPAIVTAMLLDGRVVYQNPRSQQYMGNLINSFNPPPGFSLTSLSSSLHPLKRLFRFDQEALQTFEAAMATESEFRRVIKVPKRIKQPQHSAAAGVGQLSPSRVTVRGRACATRERPGASRLVLQASGLDSLVPGAGAGAGSAPGSRGEGPDSTTGGANGPAAPVLGRSGRVGLVSRESSMTRASQGSLRTGLASTSRRGGMMNGVASAAPGRRGGVLMAHTGAGSAAGGAVGAAAAAAGGVNVGARRFVRRCTSVMNLGGRAGLTSNGLSRPGSTMASRTPSFLGLAGGGPGVQLQEPRMLKAPIGGVSGPMTAAVVQPVCLSDSSENPNVAVLVAAAAGVRPSGAVTWTAGVPVLEGQVGGGGGSAGRLPVANCGGPAEPTTEDSSADILCDLPTGIMLSGPQRRLGPNPEGQLESCSMDRSSEERSITRAPKASSKPARLLAAVSAEPISIPQEATVDVAAAITATTTSPRFRPRVRTHTYPHLQKHKMHSAGPEAEALGTATGEYVANGVGSSAMSQRTRSLTQLSIDSTPSSPPFQVARSARSFVHGASSRVSSTHLHPNVSGDSFKPVEYGISLGLGLGLGLGAGHEESATDRASISPRSSRMGRHGSFIMLGGAGSSVGPGALAASASAFFRRSASADPAGLLVSGCSSRKGTSHGMLNISSGASSCTTSPRTSGRARCGNFFRSRSIEHPHVKGQLQLATHSDPPSPPRMALNLVEVTPTFIDANGQEVEEGNHLDPTGAGLRQYCIISSGGGGGSTATRPQAGPTPALRVPVGLRGGGSGAGREAGSPPGLGAVGPLLACVNGMIGPSPGGNSPGFRNSCNLLSAIQEEGIEQRGSKEDDAVETETAVGLSHMALAPEARWSAGSGVRHQAGSSSGAGGMLLDCGELEASVEQQAEAVSGFNLPSLVLTHINSSGGGLDRLTSGHNVPLPSLNLGMGSGAIDAEEFSYTSGGGGSYTSGGLGSGVFRGFGAALASITRVDNLQLSASLLAHRLQAPRPAQMAAFANSIASATAFSGAAGPVTGAPVITPTPVAGVATGTGPPIGASVHGPRAVAATAEGSAMATAAGVAGTLLATVCAARQESLSGRPSLEQQQQPGPLEAPESGLSAMLTLTPTNGPITIGRAELGLSNDGPVIRLSHGSLPLSSTVSGGGASAAQIAALQRPSGSQSSARLAAANGADIATASLQLLKDLPSLPRSAFTSAAQVGGGGVDATLREAALDPQTNPHACRQGQPAGGGDATTERYGTTVSEFGLSSGGLEEVSNLSTQVGAPARGGIFTSTLVDMDQYLLTPSPSGQGAGLPGQRDSARMGPSSVTDDRSDMHRTWAPGDKLPVGTNTIGGTASTAVFGSFTTERTTHEGMASVHSHVVTCHAPSYNLAGGGPSGFAPTGIAENRAGVVGCSSGAPTLTGTASGMITVTSTGIAARGPPVRRRNTKDRLMSLLTSLSRDGSDDEEPGDEHEWHDVYACVRMEPTSGHAVVVITQTEVTEQVEVQRKLEALLEHEHKVLESIFPRHVIEHMTLQAKHRGAAGGGAGVGAAAVGSSWANFRGSAMEALATSHSCVTILFCDIIGFTEMCKEVSAMVVMRFLNTLYMKFDELIDIYGVYKVETIGDCYMVAGGLVRTDVEGNKSVIGDGSEDALHAVRVMSFAKAIMREAAEVVLPTSGEPVQLRVGLHSGPVMSGIVGDKMPRFCLFGDTVNTASRMESTCPPGAIHVSADTRALLQNEAWVATGGVQVKGKGLLETYVWAGHAAEEDEDAERRLKVYL